MVPVEKKNGYFWHTFTFLVTRERHKIPLAYPHILLTMLAMFAFPNFWKLRIHVWFLFGVTRGVDVYFCHFRVINK